MTRVRNGIGRELYPELRIGGFSRVSVPLQFYSRINALVTPESIVVDLGAGRGEAHIERQGTYLAALMNFKGRVKRVIGLDVDSAVLSNPSVDEARILTDKRLPLEDGSVDVLFSDWTFEHVADPESLARELARVVKPGGYVCARTPNRWGYIGFGANAIPNRLHTTLLKILQPDRQAKDVFPTTYQMNSWTRLRRLFPDREWERTIFTLDGEPAYFGNSKTLWRAAQLLFRLTPPGLNAVFLIFMKRRGDT